VRIQPDALEHLVNVAGGDARSVLNALELAVETTPPDDAGEVVVDMAVAEESIQRRAVLYDRDGDAHYDTISAFIKSLRGSDPDAALYWLAKMVHAGEDPRFMFRRMLILASEDVGLADPQAVMVVTACADAFDRVGLPEGRYHLAEAALYLATAPKSNSILAFFDALHTVEKEGKVNVPSHLKDASRDKKGFGHGEGYLYPHAYRDHWTAQQYLPDALQGKMFYNPSHQGDEKRIFITVNRRREAQLAAMVEGGCCGARGGAHLFSRRPGSGPVASAVHQPGGRATGRGPRPNPDSRPDQTSRYIAGSQCRNRIAHVGSGSTNTRGECLGSGGR
jgi:putative ATPase